MSADLFLFSFSNEEIVAATGVTRETFVYVFDRYCGQGTPISKPVRLYHLFVFYKLYPVARACNQVFGTTIHAYNRFLSRLYVYERYLSSVIEELREAWDNRLGERNRLPHAFGPHVTGSIDTFPINVNRPKDALHQRLLYNGK
jgi:hypothetical protein